MVYTYIHIHIYYRKNAIFPRMSQHLCLNPLGYFRSGAVSRRWTLSALCLVMYRHRWGTTNFEWVANSATCWFQIMDLMQAWSAWVVVDVFLNQWGYRHLPRSRVCQASFVKKIWRKISYTGLLSLKKLLSWTSWYFRTPQLTNWQRKLKSCKDTLRVDSLCKRHLIGDMVGLTQNEPCLHL